MTVDIHPGTLNLGSKGRWVTCYIELSEGYDVGDIDVSSILLNGTVAAEEAPVEVGDYDGDGVEDLMVKFDRGEVVEELDWEWGATYSDALVITLELDDGTEAEGSDTVRVKSRQGKGVGKKGGASQGGPPGAPPGQGKGQGKPEHPPHPKGKEKKGKGGK